MLEEIIERNPDYNVKVIFNASSKSDDAPAMVVKHLLAVAAKGNNGQTRRALDDWYMAETKEYSSFATKYPMNGELKQQEAGIDAMASWCREAEITYTPTLYIHGKRLPDTYSIEELKNIL